MKELNRFRQYLAESVIKEDNLKDYWPEWAAGEVEVGNDGVIAAGGVNADFKDVPNDTMDTFKKYVKAVKTLNADSKELRDDIAVAISGILYDGGGFKDYKFDVLTSDQFSKIQKTLNENKIKKLNTFRKYLAEGRLLKEELRDVEDILVKAGFRFDDGILGGVGSGGAGYYDLVNDAIYGYNQSGPWNEEEFNKFYDNFEFNSTLYDSEDLEDLEISQPQLDKGIYAVEDMGYVEIRSNGDIIIYAMPQLSDKDGSNFLPAFKMDDSGRAIPQFSKDKMRKMLKDDMMYIM